MASLYGECNPPARRHFRWIAPTLPSEPPPSQTPTKRDCRPPNSLRNPAPKRQRSKRKSTNPPNTRQGSLMLTIPGSEVNKHALLLASVPYGRGSCAVTLSSVSLASRASRASRGVWNEFVMGIIQTLGGMRVRHECGRLMLRRGALGPGKSRANPTHWAA